MPPGTGENPGRREERVMGRDKSTIKVVHDRSAGLGNAALFRPADAQSVDAGDPGVVAADPSGLRKKLPAASGQISCLCAKNRERPHSNVASSKGRQTKKDFQRDLVKGVIQKHSANALSPQQSGPSPEEIQRKQEEGRGARKREEEARILREAEERGAPEDL